MTYLLCGIMMTVASLYRLKTAGITVLSECYLTINILPVCMYMPAAGLAFLATHVPDRL